MKPKERFINYALLTSTSTKDCEPNDRSPYNKEIDILPIDLSVKKSPSLANTTTNIITNTVIGDHSHHHFGLFHQKEPHHNQHHYENHHFRHRTTFLNNSPSPTDLAEWPVPASNGRFCFPNLIGTKNGGGYHGNGYHHPGSIFPYFFINPNCLPPPLPPTSLPPDITSASAVAVTEKKTPDSTILDLPPYIPLPYRLHHGQDDLLFPIKINDSDHHHHLSYLSNHHHHSRHHHHFNNNGDDPHHHRKSPNGDNNPPLSIESSSSSSTSTVSTSSSPYEYHIPDYNDIKNGIVNGSASKMQVKSQNSVSNNHNNNDNNHHQTKLNGSPVAYDPKTKLKKSLSYPSLPTISLFKQQQNNNSKNKNNSKLSSFLLIRSKSECNLHLIKQQISSKTISTSMTTSILTTIPTMDQNKTTITSPSSPPSLSRSKICAPKKMFASNYYQNLKESLENTNNSNKNDDVDVVDQYRFPTKTNGINGNHNDNKSNNNSDTQTHKFYRNYRKEAIECWDNERRDNEQTINDHNHIGNNKTNNNILDLRTNMKNSIINTAICNSSNNNINNLDNLEAINLKAHNNHHNINDNNNLNHNKHFTLDLNMKPSVPLNPNNNNSNNNHHYPVDSSNKLFRYDFPEKDPPPTLPLSLPSFVGKQQQEQQSSSPHSLTHPIDLYKQYYYYLMQEPAFASKAAVAVAETYAKLLSNSNSPEQHQADKTMNHILMNYNGNHQHHNGNNHDHTNHSNSNNANNKSSPSSTVEHNNKSFENNSLYETKRTSPDCSQDGLRTELRSADTTNGNMIFDRKRISRPLTGKHVRHGTGASPSTLVSLRNMIQQRQKLKELGKFDCNMRYGKGKANKRIKRK